MQAVCCLLKIDQTEIQRGLCARLITAGGESMVKQETAARASQCRDALAKAIYSKLFDYVVKCVNSALRKKHSTATSVNSTNSGSASFLTMQVKILSGISQISSSTITLNGFKCLCDCIILVRSIYFHSVLFISY